jgi:capsular polysaccharide biosynthesis protein
MSEQALDVRGSWHVVRRHRRLVAIFAGLGLLVGAVFTVFNPPVLASKALVVLPPTIRDISTQVVIANSDPVLQAAAHDVDPPVSLRTLRKRVTVKSVTANVISVEAHGPTAGQAESAANAVAQSYIAYVASPSAPSPEVQSKLLESATTATQRPLAVQVIENEVAGALIGLLLGAVIALGLSRGDKHLRRRDDIADSIGVPVLASIPVGHPSSPGDWTKLLQDYQPGVVHSWRLRNALHYLGLTDANLAGGRDGSGSSLAVVSLSSDRRALALGPQLAVFAASLGIPTSLVIGTQQDANVTASLQAACGTPLSPARRSSRLQVTVADPDRADRPPDAALTVVVVVVDPRSPRVAETMPTSATVLGVSAGGATAAELARVALSAAAVGRQVTGILVADPDSADRTTGRIPQLVRPPQRRMPTRLTGTPTETRP